MPAIEKRSLLMDSVLLRGVPESELKRVETFIRRASYAKGERIFRKGEPGRGMMTVVSGRVKIAAPAGSAEAFLGIIGPNEVFGEIALLDGGPRTADAIALEKSELLVLDRRDFLDLLSRNPSAYINLLTVLCDRIRSATEMVEDSLFLDLPARLGRALLRLGEHHGTKVPEGTRIDVRFSQRELARSVGMTRESINKQLGLWRASGTIQMTDGHIVLRDVDALLEEVVRRS